MKKMMTFFFLLPSFSFASSFLGNYQCKVTDSSDPLLIGRETINPINIANLKSGVIRGKGGLIIDFYGPLDYFEISTDTGNPAFASPFGIPREIIGSISIIEKGHEQYELNVVLIPTVRVYDSNGSMTFIPSLPVTNVKLSCW
jgi:hypothetical protein